MIPFRTGEAYAQHRMVENQLPQLLKIRFFLMTIVWLHKRTSKFESVVRKGISNFVFVIAVVIDLIINATQE